MKKISVIVGGVVYDCEVADHVTEEDVRKIIEGKENGEKKGR